MGYHTHFYACDPTKQVDWAKQILSKYQKQLKHELDNFPNDDFFKNIYKMNMEETSKENYELFHENAKKYNWGKWYIDEQEEFYHKCWDPNYTWETIKQEWVDRLEKLKSTGLFDLKFDGDYAMDYVALLVENWKEFDYLNAYDLNLNFECKDGKIYSGDILKCYYRVKGRYCESMWFNWENIIEMIEDYVDTTSYDPETHEYKKNRVLSTREKRKIENFFRDYPDSYCLVI